MSDINIPGVTDKYKTNELIQALVEEAKIPLTREEDRLETYQAEGDSWRILKSEMSKLRESVRSLYSFDNPFNARVATSTEESSVTAKAERNAEPGSFKLDVLKIAKSDRFLSSEIDAKEEVPKGKYTFRVGEKKVSFDWKGGKISSFTDALNKRSTGVVKARLIGITKDSKSLLIESLITGGKNRLEFEDAALDFALDKQIIQKKVGKDNAFTITKQAMKNTDDLFSSKTTVNKENILVPPKSGFEYTIPQEILSSSGKTLEISLALSQGELTEGQEQNPVLPSSGSVQFNTIEVVQDTILTGIENGSTIKPPPIVEDNTCFFLKMKDGTEIKLPDIPSSGEEKTFTLSLDDYDSLSGFIVKNKNTNKTLTISQPTLIDEVKELGYEPINAVSTAEDAKIKYEGITMSREINTIDDIIPKVELSLEAPTEKTATIKIDPDTDSAKENLIGFVGNYNKLLGEINIVTQTKSEIITELEYLSKEEQDEAKNRLGMFQTEYSLRSSKQNLQNIISRSYKTEDTQKISMLSEIGISTNASSGFSGVSQSRLRGYLEIDEEKLDAALKDNIKDVKNIFGFDSDNDKVIDTGIGYLMDKNLQAYTQIGGIIALKTIGLDSKIKASKEKITDLEADIAVKEQRWKQQYGSMEGSLNSLESQKQTISNFNDQSKNR